MLVRQWQTVEWIGFGESPRPQISKRQLDLTRLEIQSAGREVCELDRKEVDMDNLILQHPEVAEEKNVAADGGVREQVEPPGERCPPVVQSVLGIAPVGLDESRRCLLAQAKLTGGRGDNSESRPSKDNKTRAGNSLRPGREEPKNLFSSQN